MQASVIVFPGSNCDRDVAVCIEAAMGKAPLMAWHGDSDLPKSDLIVLPGGFSYGDYLRCGSMAANSPIMREVVAQAKKGAAVLGICNGFQVLTECGLLPGVLMQNKGLNFVCRNTRLTVTNNKTAFTAQYEAGEEITVPVAHNEGNYFADDDTLKRFARRGLYRLYLCGRRQPQWRLPRYCRYLRPVGPYCRHDAASRTTRRSRTGR